MVNAGAYAVYVDENSHWMDPSERHFHGSFPTCDAAVAACKQIVDAYLTGEGFELGDVTAERLWQGYTLFGDDPFIVSKDATCRFSAWGYARWRCSEIAAAYQSGCGRRDRDDCPGSVRS